jgi:cell division septum initiation protein DivIVA
MGELPERLVTINQLVAFNITWYRKASGLTQDELGERLGGWSGASVSAAERSWDGKRIRKFDADEIVNIAFALGVPVIALLLPPADAGTAVDYTAALAPTSLTNSAALLAHLFPAAGGTSSPAMEAFRERVTALGASGLLSPGEGEALQRAADEALLILEEARKQAEETTGTAQARAESLERDAIARHRQAMGSLLEQRRELEQRVHDLRAFEREYRSRLLAYLEEQVRDLRAGAADADVFPAVEDGGG